MAKEQIKHLIHTLHRIVGKCCCLHRWRPFAKDVLLWQSGWSTIKCVHSCVHFYYFYALCRSAIGPHSWKHNYEQFFEERLPKRRLSLHIPNHLDQTWGCHNTFFIAVLLSFVIWSSFGPPRAPANSSNWRGWLQPARVWKYSTIASERRKDCKEHKLFFDVKN